MSEMPNQPRVMIVGKDARTDAMSEALARSDRNPYLIGVSEFSAPGLIERCDRFYGDRSMTDVDAIVEIAETERPDLVVIGPEEPLAAGVVDAIVGKLDTPCFGPAQALARIESSKSWARDLVARHGVAGNPHYEVCRDSRDVTQAVRALREFVVKPDGLTGGKGVKLSHQHFDQRQDAVDYAVELAKAEGLVLIEEVLEGEEFSLQTITDGRTSIHAPLVQDHKRAYEGDTGPNTGGMGSYSCADGTLPFLTESDIAEAKAINEHVVRAIEAETGERYRGVLYGGFMATADGVRLIEYNCRFGDPEAMNVLPLLRGDFLDVCWNVALGQLRKKDVAFEALASVCRYLVPEGYPTHNKHAGESVSVEMRGIDPARSRLFWAAVRKSGDQTLLTGSRAIACVGYGENLAEANASAAELTSRVTGPVFGRTDIGSATLLARRVDHMRALRSNRG